ncbi:MULTISPECIES: NUDIX hydrolase [Pseudomonas]|uniref:NUDIX hydrolase n=1 Tax=Pseudomonas TaxID=286 RepID=UPI000313F3BC|nr:MULTISPECIES: NUDIX hydrolase [Pseudomonas]MBP1118894.1 ADP-ribose pyrophosphatase YjhB (NUDIX family) [Pseudomonas sp. PvP028]QWB04625.1 NUDIX hydrolase [Pseudomonas syringae]
MINPVKHNFSHLGFSNAQSTSALGPASNKVPNFVSRGRGKGVPVEEFNTAEECRLAGRQDSVLDSIDGKEFMRLLQKYTASETTEEEFADLRASIPRYSIELAKSDHPKVLYRGISLDDEAASLLLNTSKGYRSREIAHGLIHGLRVVKGVYTATGVASASTVSAVSQGFALVNANRKKETPVLFVLKAMPAVPALNHSGAKGVTLSESRLPLSVASKSEHEVILDITNRYEITQARRSGEFIVVDMTVLGRSKRGGEFALVETDKWKQLSGAKGSNPGGLFQAPNGVKWYVKTNPSANRLRNEVLASRLYRAAGIDVPDIELASRKGKPALISKLIVGNPKDLDTLAKNSQLKCGFAVDAWLANWDVIGLTGDNVIFNHRNKPVRIDLGGALVFRAQGEHKGNQFGTTPMELVTMLSREDNSSSRAFRKIERNDIREGIAAIEKIPDARIAALCAEHGPGNHSERVELGKRLISRKKWLVDMKQTLPYIHRQKNERGDVVTVKKPTSPSAVDTWRDRYATAVFVPHSAVRGSMNNLPFRSFTPPNTMDGWRRFTTRAVNFTEPEFKRSPHLAPASGAIIFEPDGRVWITEPTNHPFGATHAFPKGKQEAGLNLRTNALKEVYEETGLLVEFHGFIGDYDRTTSRTRYYLAKRIDGTPSDMGFESQSVKLANITEAKRLLPNAVDIAILRDAEQAYLKGPFK